MNKEKSNKEAVKALREQDQRMPAATIARKLGISREWVRQNLLGLGLETNIMRRHHFCSNCGVQVKNYKTRLCWKCYIASRLPHMMEIICDHCGKIFLRKLKVVKQALKHGYKHNFCCRKCFYSWYRSKREGNES